MKARMADADLSQADRSPLTGAEAERLLIAWQTRQRSEGLEARILGRLHDDSFVKPILVPRRLLSQPSLVASWKHTWAMAPIAASLICVLSGGFLVARETAKRPDRERLLAKAVPAQLAPMTSPGQVVGRAPELKGLATASARRKPVGLIPAGRRRGRAGATAASASK